jgi:hypothetical protein
MPFTSLRQSLADHQLDVSSDKQSSAWAAK